jgi:hypothetical protein
VHASQASTESATLKPSGKGETSFVIIPSLRTELYHLGAIFSPQLFSGKRRKELEYMFNSFIFSGGCLSTELKGYQSWHFLSCSN